MAKNSGKFITILSIQKIDIDRKCIQKKKNINTKKKESKNRSVCIQSFTTYVDTNENNYMTSSYLHVARAHLQVPSSAKFDKKKPVHNRGSWCEKDRRDKRSCPNNSIAACLQLGQGIVRAMLEPRDFTNGNGIVRSQGPFRDPNNGSVPSKTRWKRSQWPGVRAQVARSTLESVNRKIDCYHEYL